MAVYIQHHHQFKITLILIPPSSMPMHHTPTSPFVHFVYIQVRKKKLCRQYNFILLCTSKKKTTLRLNYSFALTTHLQPIVLLSTDYWNFIINSMFIYKEQSLNHAYPLISNKLYRNSLCEFGEVFSWMRLLLTENGDNKYGLALCKLAMNLIGHFYFGNYAWKRWL